MSYATRFDAGIVNSANCCARLRAVCQGMSETLSETILRGNPVIYGFSRPVRDVREELSP